MGSPRHGTAFTREATPHPGPSPLSVREGSPEREGEEELGRPATGGPFRFGLDRKRCALPTLRQLS